MNFHRAALSSAVEFDDRRTAEDAPDNGLMFWSHSPDMQAVAGVIDKVADSDATVLIRGESGVGKELVARAIHQQSPRRHRPYVKVNCAALPAELLESELFGHERGAFTGAVATRIGKFEHADSGTIFLDEVGELTAALQAKLLHVVQDGQFTKLGSNRTVGADVRLVAATNRNLEDMMLRGEFSEALFYRLRVIEITVPSLRSRRGEIAHLCRFFMHRYARHYNRPERELSDQLQVAFQQYDWPGNVRELENMIKRLVILQDEGGLLRETTGGSAGPPASPSVLCPATDAVQPPRLADVAKAAALKAERVVIEDTLHRTHWNRKRAAEQLGVSYKTLLNRIRESGISQAS